ncbi:TPA: bifunctional methylenetetrahydrofolate dehydrogenase/methenyltetrahydrofolate cyclohydrolase FolD [Legionella pneumophila subsp. pneumophila]|uniref:bifunctional methylenetetrahydrofolate dehydrogenase/methenyltetrahydrofolate cyclohydrolase FolD n=1 Tax=Legionella pneumophila TaxID=446 RepID=UPI00077076AE|nr:bifunctional methylenetetrahydrofolate dehydrogenase/methenyltetrahydrofolate cyclohydrolase FolD [Legionella pneumophila]HAT9214664.1 bifunctional methylenetetrahydrofolate dehydrogenase/methenyltetrahydrofolate cyclohydrolase FolD [Legionella pneumophila subsp. pneumophila]CZI07182.1 PPDC [Legionella pneumophila]HAT9260269.1 bifunctional methylenetetrahydrofolate dehydrogenase/methenyltetrahydrofolate cyclohydrolase FolD [Legionella pneumophila subsp. pneumophila]HAT9283710.1 bifunctional 
MPASLIDGREISALRRAELKQRVQYHIEQGQRAPALAVVLIGNDPASVIYVSNKRKACEEVGITSHSYDLPAETTQEKLIELINELNQSDKIDGILIQLPLPKHINERTIIEHIKPEKDVDGFHPYNLGRLAQRNPFLRPCTPLGIMNLLHHYELNVKRKHAVVIGASNIVGRPMSLELLLAGATVTICHKFTQQLQKFVEIADFLIVATGKMDVIATDWLREHQVVIDVGMHRLPDGSIRGDIDFKKAVEKVAWITPVPGGVGPMTIVTLLENTMMSAARLRE